MSPDRVWALLDEGHISVEVAQVFLRLAEAGIEMVLTGNAVVMRGVMPNSELSDLIAEHYYELGRALQREQAVR